MSRRERRQHTHDAIVRAAARAFRRAGFAASGVDGIMAEVDLTHGGFYAHFRSKEDLLEEALVRAGTETQDALFGRLAGRSGAAWALGFVEGYLAPGHVAAPEHGCPMPALAPDASRAGEPVRRAFTRVVERLAAEFRARTGAADERAEDAIFATVALAVGAVVLARAVRGTPLADRLLAACVRFARSVFGPAAGGPFPTLDPGGRP